jgi:hypothetical protein
VTAEKKGILEPQNFLKLFSTKVKITSFLYHGNPNSTFVESVRSGELEGMSFEGVVCKGKCISPGRPLMFKIKNRAWIEKIKMKYVDQPEMIEELM